MLKFVRALSVLYLISIIYFIIYMIFEESLKDYGVPILLIIYIILFAMPIVSLILLFYNEKFSPAFEFRYRKLAIIAHILFMVLVVSTTSGNFSFLLAGPEEPSMATLLLIRTITVLIFILPLVNFVSIFNCRFLNRNNNQ